jgi:hypothetical protein
VADLIPFDSKKHKPVKTVGGGSSTEYLASEQSPEGTAWNIPTIWFDSATGKPKYLEGDKAWNEAESYEKRTGKKFPRYKTINDAVSAAKSRSKKGGATKGGLAQSVPKDFAEGGEVMADSEEETFFDRYNPLYGSYRKETPTSVKVVDRALDFTPVGTAKTVGEIVEEGRQDDPNYLKMGLMSLAEMLGYAPAIGPAVKTMARGVPADLEDIISGLNRGSVEKEVKNYRLTLEKNSDLSPEEIDYLTNRLSKRLKNPEKKAEGGEVMSGIGSLNETARAMTRGPRGIGSYLQYMAEGGEVAEDEFFEKLVKGVVTAESSGDPLAVSPDGAIGLMQVLPSTARDPGMGLKDIFSIAEGMGYSYPDRSRESIRQLLFVPEINVAVGTQYLKKMLSLFPKTEDGLRAYNAGPTGYRKFLEAGGTGGVDKENFEYPFRVMAFASGTPLPDFKNEAGPELLSDYQALSGMDSPSSVTMFPSRERGVGTNFIASDAEPVSFAVNPAFESTIKPKMRPADPAFGLSDPALGLVPPIERVMRPKMRPASPEAMTIEVDPITGEPVVAPPAESLYEKYSPENMEKDLISGIGSLVS